METISVSSSFKYILCLLLLLLTSNAVAKEEKLLPLWEVGAIAGVLSIPHYVGSNQRYNLPLILHSFVYRGEYLRATRGGMRGLFYSSDNFAIDVGLSGTLPVYSGDNDARSGMPDIPLAGEIGPRLVYRFYGNGDGSGINITGRLPWRIVAGIDGTDGGWTMEPEILVSDISLPWKIDAYASAGVKYGSKAYNSLFYGVDQQYSNANRPAYKAKEGISHYSFSLNIRRWWNHEFSAGLYLGWKTMSGSIVENSPLVKSKDNLSATIWFRWLPWKSDAKESDIERMPEPEEDI